MLKVAEKTLKVFALGSKLLMKREVFSPILVKHLCSNPVLFNEVVYLGVLLEIKLSISQAEF